jgi:hypothetical protein
MCRVMPRRSSQFLPDAGQWFFHNLPPARLVSGLSAATDNEGRVGLGSRLCGQRELSPLSTKLSTEVAAGTGMGTCRRGTYLSVAALIAPHGTGLPLRYPPPVHRPSPPPVRPVDNLCTNWHSLCTACGRTCGNKNSLAPYEALTCANIIPGCGRNIIFRNLHPQLAARRARTGNAFPALGGPIHSRPVMNPTGDAGFDGTAATMYAKPGMCCG